MRLHRLSTLLLIAFAGNALAATDPSPALPKILFPRDFAPSEGFVKPQEKPFRREICLNGRWQFQPVQVPSGFRAESGTPPELAPPVPDRWDGTPLKVPSPWNANALLMDQAGRGGDMRNFPSYPKSWEQVRMAWLRRKVIVPADWRGQRIVIHFEAVAGQYQVLINGARAGEYFDTAMPHEMDITNLVRLGQSNEVLVGIRDARLFSKRGRLGSLTYPAGSFWLENARGIWQDVFLLARPAVFVSDVFIKPLVSQGRLEVEVEVTNTGSVPVRTSVDVAIYTWVNKVDFATAARLDATEPNWSLGKEVLRLAKPLTLAPGETGRAILSRRITNELELWEVWQRGRPNLYAALASVSQGRHTLDRRFERFGWREYQIRGREFLLNGRPIQLFNDFWHFMGVTSMTRRYAYAWYTAAKQANINFIRPHAMPHPRFYFDLADEMGMMIIPESGFWSSNTNLNYDAPEFWERARRQVHDLVIRDRNHASVMGWSVSNEVWVAMQGKNATEEYRNQLWDKIRELAQLAAKLDPTRQWQQSDGDRDLYGRLPTFTLHWGNGPFRWDYSTLPDKPWGVTEGGSSYYGRPSQYTNWVGDRAYRSFLDRMDGLAIEAYTILKELREHGAICNVVNIAWHGLKPLPLGLADVRKKQLDLSDGIRFKPYEEGKPGIQPERLGPFSTVFNPGYDASLPLFEPLPEYLAIKAALDPRGPQACAWDSIDKQSTVAPPPVIGDPIKRIGFLGGKAGAAYRILQAAGAPMDDNPAGEPLVIIDLESLAEPDAPRATAVARSVVQAGGTVIVNGVNDRNQQRAGAILPYDITASARESASLLPDLKDPRVASIPLEFLYFAEDPVNQLAARYALGGEFVRRGTTLLAANKTDWLRWLRSPEYVKTVSVYRSELENGNDPVMVEVAEGSGRYIASTLNLNPAGPLQVRLFRKLLANFGVALAPESKLTLEALDEAGTLQRALVGGRFGGGTLEAALTTDFLDAATTQPTAETITAERPWKLGVAGGNRGFGISSVPLPGPATAFAVYFSFWVNSPRGDNDLLEGGPNPVQVRAVSEASFEPAIWLNGTKLQAAESKAGDAGVLSTYERLPLKKGWNHFLVKAVSEGIYTRATFGLRLQASDPSYLRQLISAVEGPQPD